MNQKVKDYILQVEIVNIQLLAQIGYNPKAAFFNEPVLAEFLHLDGDMF